MELQQSSTCRYVLCYCVDVCVCVLIGVLNVHFEISTSYFSIALSRIYTKLCSCMGLYKLHNRFIHLMWVRRM
jgi:hypothetical protein